MLLCFVNDLLDLRQISEGLFEIKPNVFDPNLVLGLVCEMFKPQARSQKTQLIFEVKRQLENPKDRRLLNSKGI